jgi:uncharacterized surface protein with fasciclin (FAS1) repeats
MILFSGVADARGCGMMRPPAYMSMAIFLRGYPMQHKMPASPGYGDVMKAGPNVLTIAKRTGDFTTLLQAGEAAGLTGLLGGDGPFTLFAPTDAAFENLPEGALEELLADKAKLVALLKYHVVPGRVPAAEILTIETLETATGQLLPTTNLGVIRADVPVINGIVHVVGKVLLPVSGAAKASP